MAGYSNTQVAPHSGVIMHQPGMMMNSPSGGNILEVIKQARFLKIVQRVDLLEVVTGFQVANKYDVMDEQERKLLTVMEETDLCQLLCCGPLRGFNLHVQDNVGQEIAQIHREFKCCAGCCWCASIDCCSLELWVDSPVGRNIAHIKQRSFCCFPEFKVLNGQEQEIFEVGGPCCCFCQFVCCTDDLEFPVHMNGEKVAIVTKIWDGIARSCLTNANTFGIHFLQTNMDVNRKLAIFGCVFELDYVFFEHKSNH